MAKAELKEGTAAPEFSAASSEGGEISLAKLKGKAVVLYFYPKDDTPGCTAEACAFRDTEAEMRKLGAVVLGVSKDGIASHVKFKAKYALNFPLLADPHGEIISAYSAWKDRTIFGKTALGVERCTFLIDREGVIRRIWRNVKAEGHAKQVLEALKDSLTAEARWKNEGIPPQRARRKVGRQETRGVRRR